jgi:hypothetical protein
MEPILGTTINQQTTFDDIIDQIASYLKGEELEIETGVAPIGKKEIWEQIFKGNFLPMLKSNQIQNNEILGIHLALSFLQNLKKIHQNLPNKLALSQKNNKVFVWAEVPDNDDDMVDAVLASVIDANFEHRDGGLTISPMIVQESENLQVPPHYKLI